MRTLRLSLVGTVVLTLVVGLGGAVLAQMDADADAVYVTPVSDEESERCWMLRQAIRKRLIVVFHNRPPPSLSRASSVGAKRLRSRGSSA